MRLFTSESLFNIKTGQWEERFWIDGIITDPDLYFFELDREKELEANKLLKEKENEDYEDDCCDHCDCYECTIERYVQLLCELTGGCPNCIRMALECFCDDIVEHIVVENIEDDENLNR